MYPKYRQTIIPGTSKEEFLRHLQGVIETTDTINTPKKLRGTINDDANFKAILQLPFRNPFYAVVWGKVIESEDLEFEISYSINPYSYFITFGMPVLLFITILLQGNIAFAIGAFVATVLFLFSESLLFYYFSYRMIHRHLRKGRYPCTS